MAWDRLTPLATDEQHAHQTHRRWAATRLSARYGQEKEGIPDQCGACRFYVPLRGRLGFDWGACTSPESPHGGTLMFEHDGCDQFAVDDGPVHAEHVRWLEIARDSLADEIQELRAEVPPVPPAQQ